MLTEVVDAVNAKRRPLTTTMFALPVMLIAVCAICREDEDIFLRLAFQNSSSGGSYRGTGPFIVSVVSEMYEPLDAERKLEIRQWWHEKVRGEASEFDDLRTQLSKLT